MTESSAKLKQVDKNQIKKAVNALLKYHTSNDNEKTNNDLLGNDTNIHLQFGLGQAVFSNDKNNPSTNIKPNMKPKRIPIPHSLYQTEETQMTTLEEANICIFVKDEKSKKLLQEIQSTSELSEKSSHLRHIKKIIQLPKLRKNYNTYAQKLELVNEYDIFFVDDRILPMVGECLGKIFYKRKKQPIPIRLGWDIPVFIRDCLHSTFMILPFGGLCVSVRAGRTNMPSDHIIDNCISIITHAVSNHIPNAWSNVQNIHVKLTNSIALPIYKATLDLSSNNNNNESTTTKDSKNEKEVVDKKQDNEKKDEKKSNKNNNNPIMKALDQMKKKDKDDTTNSNKRKMKKDDHDDNDKINDDALVQQKLKKSKKEKKRNKKQRKSV